MQQIPWYAGTPLDVLGKLRSREGGLTSEEVALRLKEYGLNKLPEGKVDSVFVIFFRQFQSPLIYILFLAAGTILAMGETVDASIIFTVLIFNAVVGTVWEGSGAKHPPRLEELYRDFGNDTAR
ncbi:MAG: hypothetical protein HZA94_01065 [Candidatus Vogelbacteria bacterium]|nr:hypothetical protein [Candidatus Vogelbacteria bacterium]